MIAPQTTDRSAVGTTTISSSVLTTLDSWTANSFAIQKMQLQLIVQMQTTNTDWLTLVLRNTTYGSECVRTTAFKANATDNYLDVALPSFYSRPGSSTILQVMANGTNNANNIWTANWFDTLAACNILINSSTPSFTTSGTNTFLNVATSIDNGTTVRNVNITQINSSASAASAASFFTNDTNNWLKVSSQLNGLTSVVSPATAGTMTLVQTVGQNGTGGSTTVLIDNATSTRNANLLLLNSSTPTYSISGTNMLLNVASVINTGTSTANVNVIQINGSSAAASALSYFDTRSINTTTRVISAFISDLGLQQLWEWPLTQIDYDPTDPPAAQSVGGVLIQALTLWSLNATYNAVFTAASLANVPNSTTSALIQFTTSGTNHYVQTDMKMDAGATQSAGDIVSILDGISLAITGFTFNGAFTRSFHVQDNASNSLQSAHVRIGFNNQAELHTTPVSGNFTTALDAHTYAIDATCDGFSGYSGSLTVSGVGSTTLVLTAASVSPPALPGVCRVYFYLYNSAGSPMNGSTVTWQINTPPYNTGQQPPASTAAVDGLVYADVPKGITLQPTTPLGLQKEFTVPSDAGSTLEYAP